jgi:hypothetical protein
MERGATAAEEEELRTAPQARFTLPVSRSDALIIGDGRDSKKRSTAAAVVKNTHCLLLHSLRLASNASLIFFVKLSSFYYSIDTRAVL